MPSTALKGLWSCLSRFAQKTIGHFYRQLKLLPPACMRRGLQDADAGSAHSPLRTESPLRLLQAAQKLDGAKGTGAIILFFNSVSAIAAVGFNCCQCSLVIR